MMQKIILHSIFASLFFLSVSAHAAIPEGNAGVLRLSFAFGQEKKAYEPWLGFSLSHRDQALTNAPQERKDDGMETAVSFNLAAPELALTSNNTRTVLLLEKPEDRRLSSSCDDPAPVATNNKVDSIDNVMLAAGGAIVIGTIVYFFMNDTTQIGVC